MNFAGSSADLDLIAEFIAEWSKDVDWDEIGGDGSNQESPQSGARGNWTCPSSKRLEAEVERLEREARLLGETLETMRAARMRKQPSPEALANASRWYTEARKQRRLLLQAETEIRKLKVEFRVQKDRARSLYRILMKRIASVHKEVYSVALHVPNAAPFVDTNDYFPKLLAETNAMVAQVDAMKKLLREKVALPTKNGSFRDLSVKREASSGMILELIDSEELPFPQSRVNRAIEAMYRAYEVDQVARESFSASDGTLMVATLSQFSQDGTLECKRHWQVVQSFVTDAASVFVSSMLFQKTTESWEPIAGTTVTMQEWRFVSKCEDRTALQETVAITTLDRPSSCELVCRGFPYTPESINGVFSVTNRLIETLLVKASNRGQ